MTKGKILFTHSYFYRFDQKQWHIGEPYPPLMTITAASYMRANQYDVGLFDTALVKDPHEIIAKLDDFQPDYLVVFDDGFNYLTKMCLTTMREAAFEMQKLAKSRGIDVITCSSDASDHYEKYLEHGADFVIRGEGEVSLLKLIDALVGENEETAKNIPGVCFQDKETVKSIAKGEVIRNLDMLPQAAWDLVDMESYTKIWHQKHTNQYINLATTRGCPYKCNWCAKPIYGNRYNSRSVKLVVDEIELHVKKHDINHFWMCDDIFGLKPGWVREFDKELKSRNLEIRYKIQSRADLLLTDDTISALASSGADEVWLGAESGSQRILDAMDKGTKVEQIYEATRNLHKHNVKVAFFIQLGYLGEESSDIQKTIKMITDLKPDNLGISVSYPLPGTGFYERVKSQLEEKQNWTDSDDLDTMFRSTYPKRYYKKLHRYIHRVYNRHVVWNNLKEKASPSSIMIGIFKIFFHFASQSALSLQMQYIKAWHK